MHLLLLKAGQLSHVSSLIGPYVRALAVYFINHRAHRDGVLL
jgi:hypothetical protein